MNKIYVGNLPFKTVEQELVEIFQQFGEIKEIALIRDRFSNDFKGFGFITFDTQTAAESALAMDGKDFGGRPMKVNIAREEGKREGGGGRRFGGGGRDGGRGGRGGQGRGDRQW
jgi:RNA recognition motif-containing protein